MVCQVCREERKAAIRLIRSSAQVQVPLSMCEALRALKCGVCAQIFVVLLTSERNHTYRGLYVRDEQAVN